MCERDTDRMSAARVGGAAAAEPDPLPTFAELRDREDAPDGSSWGLWRDQRLGTLNLLGPETARRARDCVRTGRVFAMDLELREIDPPLFGRPRLEHEIHRYPSGAKDDLVHGWNTQSSTQWDGFRHACHPQHGHYGGLADAEHGIDVWAARGLVARAVVADIAGWRADNGRALRHGERDPIAADELRRCLGDQGVTVKRGDMLLVRTGWLGWYRTRRPRERGRLAALGAAGFTGPGLAPDDDMAALLWDLHVSAVAADNPALEAWPPNPEEGYLHHKLLTLLGMPIGELWDLDRLVEDCAAAGTWDGLVASAPLRIRGGVGSPANAIVVR
jgi:kynurenine formamidase